MKNKKAFTLVELIIVIAIIAILAVTAFLLLTKWLAKARDSSRASNLANIENSLQISLTENSSLPKPDNYTLIYASWTSNIVGYQWYFGEWVKDSVWNINSAPKDWDDYFTYYLNADLNKYQLASFMENEVSYNRNVVSAEDYSSRYVNVRWNNLGLLTDSNKSPLQSLWLTGLDLLRGTSTYIAYLDNSTNVDWTWKQLFTYYYNNTKSLLQNSEFAKNDSSLVWYWDMKTTVDSGWILVLKDLSSYGNNGVCYNSGTAGNCGTVWPTFVQWKIWKAMQFDGVDDYIRIPDSDILDLNTWFTISSKVTFLSTAKDMMVLEKWTLGAGVWLANYYIRKTKNSSVSIECWNWKYCAWYRDKNFNWRINYGFTNANTYNPTLTYVFNLWISKVYIDWSLIYLENKWTSSIPMTWTWDLFLGSDRVKNRILNWLIDEVRIYNRALSDDEVKALYNATN